MAAAPVTAHEVCGGGREVRLLFDSTVVQVGAVTNIKRPTKLCFEVQIKGSFAGFELLIWLSLVAINWRQRFIPHLLKYKT